MNELRAQLDSDNQEIFNFESLTMTTNNNGSLFNLDNISDAGQEQVGSVNN